VRVKPFARAEVMLAERFSFPFGQRMHHFKLRLRQGFHLYLYRFFTAGQVVLCTISNAAENRCLNFNQTQFFFKLA